ncbi:MAG: lysylphosphatidylglycerol synthase transmembrane domain-containing protein [Candidatus Omnitrophota bacterium]|nr:flippase-like domain-containing protein [Candidatus Omnitrophota bacterium]
MNKKFSSIFRIFISIAILFFLIKLITDKSIIEIYSNAKKIYIFWGFCILSLTFIFLLIRWRFLLSSLGIKLPFKEVFLAFFSGLFFNLFCPSVIAGDIFRGFSISRRHGHPHKVASSILMDRFCGAFALIIIACFSFGIGRHLLPQGQVLFSILFLSFILGAASLIIFSKRFFLLLMKVFKQKNKLRRKLIDFHDQLYFFRKDPKVFLKALAISLPMQMLLPFSFFVMSKAFSLDVSIIYFFVLVPIITVIAFIPITVMGIGVRESGAVYFFSLIGIEKSIGFGLSFLSSAFLILGSIIGGILYVSVYHRWLQSCS